MRTFESTTEQFDHVWRNGIAYALIIGLFIADIVAISFPFIGGIKAPIFLMVIYYWSIYRPTLTPPWFIFVCGLLMDVLGGLPIGLNAFMFVCAHWIVAEQRRFLMSQSFGLIWLGFMFLSCLVTGMQWLIFSAFGFQFIPFEPFLYSSVLGIALFPLICVMLHMTHKILPDPPPGLHLKPRG